MTFQDYLAWRATNSRWALPRPMDRLRRSGAAQALPAHAHWTDLLAVLEREDPGQDSVTVARPVWRAYKRFQSELGNWRHPNQKAVQARPRGFQRGVRCAAADPAAGSRT